MNIAGSGSQSGSGFFSQRHGYADPDPHKCHGSGTLDFRNKYKSTNQKVSFLLLQASKEHLEKHYADLSKKSFFAGLVSYMASGPVVAMVWEGLNAVKTGDFNARC
jgi:hypothetical protein